jgi:MoxR-like ATPase
MEQNYKDILDRLGYNHLVCDIFANWENVKDEILISERKSGTGNGTIHVFLGAADEYLRNEFSNYYSAVEAGENPETQAVSIKHYFLASNLISMLGYVSQYYYHKHESFADEISNTLSLIDSNVLSNGLLETSSLFKLSTGSNKLRPYFKQFDSNGIFTRLVRKLLLPNSAYKIYLLKNNTGQYAAFWLIGFNYLTDFEANSNVELIKPQNNQQNFFIDIDTVINKIQSTGLIYSDELIKRLAYSLMAKPFVILSGLAGSGKTQLALAFAKCLSEDVQEQVCTVAVGADWTNREPLLGYPNALKSGEYVMPESGVLQLLMRAVEHPDKPHFLILDEMNMSVVERYFADFLSAMESEENIKLWDGSGDVPAEISLPKNVFIIGTINVDETTYMFSPKVLDRANVIEFKISQEEMSEYLEKTVDINPEAANSACADMAVDFVKEAKSQVAKDEAHQDILISFFKELKKVNAEFGYRTVNEISRYLYFAKDMEDNAAIDTAILQKLLPKLHGSRKKLVPVLTAMWELCLNDGKNIDIEAEFNKENFKYPESAEKIQRMLNAVVDNGFTSFAEA